MSPPHRTLTTAVDGCIRDGGQPVFVLVGDKPVRSSKRSAQWCLDSIDRCWEQKRKAIRPAELAEAKKAYDEARTAYRKILEESAE